MSSSINGDATTRTTCRMMKAAGSLSLLCASNQLTSIQAWSHTHQPVLGSLSSSSCAATSVVCSRDRMRNRGSHSHSLAASKSTVGSHDKEEDGDDGGENPIRTNIRRKQLSTSLRQRLGRREGASGTSTISSMKIPSSIQSSSNTKSVRDDRVNSNKVKSSSTRSRRAVSSSDSSSATSTATALWYQRDELVRHDLLTREEEERLGYAIVRAKELREKITAFLQEKEQPSGFEYYEEEEEDVDEGYGDELQITPMAKSVMLDSDWILDKKEEETHENIPLLWDDELLDNPSYDIIYGGSNTMNQSPVQIQQEPKNNSSPRSLPTTTVSSSSSSSSFPTAAWVVDAKKLNNVAINADVDNLTDMDIIQRLQVSGGREELLDILHAGSEARTEMMRSNVRLVVSIAKKWVRKGIGYTSSSHDNLIALYDGGWDRPSFDDLIQEGVLGLARAVDKYDPTRGLRFSTYSSYWISTYIRQLFIASSTGTLKIPAPLHEFKNSYKRIVKRSIELMEPIPTEEAIAAEIGTTVRRLRTALRVTESLLSIDQPLYMGGGAAFKGSGAGGDFSGDDGLLISDTLKCSETRAEDLVDVSFLRQCLENALATELSPHERDIIRLRLGLDDGQSRTAKEVAEECGGGISVSDVRSVEKRAFKKLRNPSSLHAHNLMDFLDMLGVNAETSKNWNWYS